jgi:SOS-response transcriptional repressor LexA
VTNQRHALLHAIAMHWREHGYPPTTRDVMARTGFPSQSKVWYWASYLKRDGLIDFQEGRRGTLRLTPAGWEAIGLEPPCICGLEPALRELERVIERKDIRISLLEERLRHHGIKAPRDTSGLVAGMQDATRG